MRHLLITVSLFYLLMTDSTVAKILNQKGSFRSSINGNTIVIPKSLLAVDEGDWKVKFEDQDITVKLQRKTEKIVKITINIPPSLAKV
jgi:hypothetical protein